MKLIAKYNRVNIPITIATLLISSIGFYFIIRYVLIHQLDKDLRIEKEEIIHYVKEKGTLPETSNYKDQQIEFYPATNDDFKTKFLTENGLGRQDGETRSYRKLEFSVTVNGNNYKAVVKKSLQETEDIIQMILVIVFSVIVLLLLVLFVANRFLLAKLWKPFNHTLEQLKQFNLSSKNIITLRDTDINEFKELNETALFMTQKVRSDYESLKKFTENASHEIQTPLAIIKNKMELLAQSENLEESQINLIQSINHAASRLSRMNQSLLLLTKIENRQFENKERIHFSYILNRLIDNLEELPATKNIRVIKNIANDFFIEMNEPLAEILISNLLINALKHNYQNGKIEIDLSGNTLTLKNTGPAPKIKTSELFERFKKESTSNESLGLGLSIVKMICDSYGFDVSYNFKEEMHVIKIIFSH
ncbi:MAG TPA: HAMP domain-containing sensor histidine kinase [Hanamia sp.]|nr:HAMP domain-containing sensor histidine kinase [Hanamia sp.]